MFCWWVWRPLTGLILELGKSYRCYLRLPGVLGGDPITGVVQAPWVGGKNTRDRDKGVNS